MTILGVHIFHYYSSNSITSNPTVFTGVNNFCLRSVAHARASVGSCQLQSADVCLLEQTCSFDMCMLFLAYFFRFRCLDVTTLFNIDVKNTFSCCRCQLLCCYSAPLLWPIYLHATRVPGISVCIFSCNCTV